MIQGGGFTVDDNNVLHQADLSIQSIYGEFTQNGWVNSVNHRRGVISMARSNDPNSASSQFFICSVDCFSLDGLYAAFGRVIDQESMDAVVELSKVPTGVALTVYSVGQTYSTDVPLSPITIVSVEVRE